MPAPTHDEVVPVTDRDHDTSWSANLEGQEHAADREAMCREARRAVTHTLPGSHVNLVTHGEHGHPETYLFDVLDGAFDDAVEYEYVTQCGCGGHVTRVHVREEVVNGVSEPSSEASGEGSTREGAATSGSEPSFGASGEGPTREGTASESR